MAWNSFEERNEEWRRFHRWEEEQRRSYGPADIQKIGEMIDCFLKTHGNPVSPDETSANVQKLQSALSRII